MARIILVGIDKEGKRFETERAISDWFFKHPIIISEVLEILASIWWEEELGKSLYEAEKIWVEELRRDTLFFWRKPKRIYLAEISIKPEEKLYNEK